MESRDRRPLLAHPRISHHERMDGVLFLRNPDLLRLFRLQTWPSRCPATWDQLPNNFQFPYFARNVSDFWRRWHISFQVGCAIISTFRSAEIAARAGLLTVMS